MASSSRKIGLPAKECRKSLTEPKKPSVKLFNFGPYQLFSFNHNQFDEFDVPLNLNLDESQQVLLDNLWNCQTQSQKTRVLYALSQYMTAIQKKPLSKNFSHYVVSQGFHCGVFVNWSSVKRATEGHT